MACALVRSPSYSLPACQLTHRARESIDVEAARLQHRAYVRALAALGLEIVTLPVLDEAPDAVFVEDTAVLLPELAILARPGAAPRRAELPTVRETLAPLVASLVAIDAPGTLDGGDALWVGKNLFVGASGRTNAVGIEQLRRHLASHGYEVVPITVRRCLHLKSAATYLGEGRVLANPARVDTDEFGSLEVIEVDPREPGAANTLSVGDVTLVPEGSARTRERLEAHSIHTRTLAISELQKAEAGLTCMSLVLPSPPCVRPVAS